VTAATALFVLQQIGDSPSIMGGVLDGIFPRSTGRCGLMGPAAALAVRHAIVRWTHGQTIPSPTATTHGRRAANPYISGKLGISSGCTIRFPGSSRIRSNSFAPFMYGYSRNAVITSPPSINADATSPIPH
jgi:hypothetical protein